MASAIEIGSEEIEAAPSEEIGCLLRGFSRWGRTVSLEASAPEDVCSLSEDDLGISETVAFRGGLPLRRGFCEAGSDTLSEALVAEADCTVEI